MTNCFVIDDEPLAVKVLSNYVNQHEQLILVGSFTNPIEALHQLDERNPALIFLDVQMPQLSGIQFLKILNNRVPVILTTAYDSYAVESYEYQVVDYLMKPISIARFNKSIIKYDFFVKLRSNIEIGGTVDVKNTSKTIYIKSGYKTIRIALSDILFMESKGDYLHIHSVNEVFKTLENLKDILNRVTSNFLRCHRSFVVNMEKIDYIENNRIIISDNYIPISRAYAGDVNKYMGK